MSVTKNWDTNLRRSEKKTLRGFLALYIFLCIAIFTLLGVVYYSAKEDSMLQHVKSSLNEYANMQIKRLKDLHINIDKTKIYPRSPHFKSAIYDSDKQTIFSLLSSRPNLDKFLYLNDGNIYYIKELESYYVGAKYLVIEQKDDGIWRKKFYMQFLWVGGPLLGFFVVIGYFLFRLFIRPMREAIALLDRFIKDTTHELNTPISAILSNVEMIDMSILEDKTKNKIKRIDIGARTVSNLYQDLVYLTLGHKVASRQESIDLKEIFEERLEYFSLQILGKNLTLKQHLASSNLYIDRTKITKLIDNLLSNAIKYNRKNGTLEVNLHEKSFTICNSGKTIPKEKTQAMFERYTRGEEQVGGFGIGLHIVAMIAKENGLKIDVFQNKKEGTCVKISW